MSVRNMISPASQIALLLTVCLSITW